MSSGEKHLGSALLWQQSLAEVTGAIDHGTIIFSHFSVIPSEVKSWRKTAADPQGKPWMTRKSADTATFMPRRKERQRRPALQSPVTSTPESLFYSKSILWCLNAVKGSICDNSMALLNDWSMIAFEFRWTWTAQLRLPTKNWERLKGILNCPHFGTSKERHIVLLAYLWKWVNFSLAGKITS